MRPPETQIFFSNGVLLVHFSIQLSVACGSTVAASPGILSLIDSHKQEMKLWQDFETRKNYDQRQRKLETNLLV